MKFHNKLVKKNKLLFSKILFIILILTFLLKKDRFNKISKELFLKDLVVNLTFLIDVYIN